MKLLAPGDTAKSIGSIRLQSQGGFLSRLRSWIQAEGNRGKIEGITGVMTGLLIGLLMLFARQLPQNWSGLIVVAAIAPTVLLVARNLKRVLFVVLVVDIPLGLDIALFKEEGFGGGPPGLVISLMTFALLIGYAVWILKRPAHKKKAFSHLDITLPIILYLFFMLVSALFAIEMRFSLYGSFMNLQFVLMYIYLINHIETWEDIRLIFSVLVISVLLESLLMLAQNYLGFGFTALGIASGSWSSDISGADVRAAGTLGPPNTAATFLATFLAITFAAVLAGNKLVRRELSLTTLLFGIAALITTQSRMAWIAFALAILIIAVGAVWRRIDNQRVGLLLVVVVLVGLGFSNQIIERFANTGQTSAMSRLWYSELAFNVIKENAFTGIGANNQRFIMDDSDYVPIELMGRNRTLIHNKYLSTWVEIGIFGFLAFLGILVMAGWRVLRTLLRIHDPQASLALAGLLAGMAAYSMHMLVATFTGRARLQILWLVVALIVATTKVVEASRRDDKPMTVYEKAA